MINNFFRRLFLPAILLCGLTLSPAFAQDKSTTAETDDNAAPAPYKPPPKPLFDSGRLLATSGISQVEGAGGGGLTPWALITGYGTADAIGANTHYTHARTGDFKLHTAGVAVGFFDRLELSLSRLWFETGSAGGRLGFGENFSFRQDIYGAKLRLIGDAVYDQDSWLPQIAIGLQYKDNNTSNGEILRSIGAKNSSGTDYYVSATKLFLEHSLLLNTTIRLTRANQIGIFGFGGNGNDSYEPQFEGSVAYLINRNLAVGGEYRMKPNNLATIPEDDWMDVFATWFVTKNLSATVAFVHLGHVALQGKQRGLYFSLKAGF